MKILDAFWFNSGGIVRVETEYEGIKYYIRSIQSSERSTPEKDALLVAGWGNTFPNAAGDALFGVKL